MFALAGVAVLPNYTNADTTATWRDSPESMAGTNMISDASLAWSKLIDSIKNTIKWILGILATVAVVICLYAGFVMMTSAGDENKYKNGMKILKYAAIGLAIILLSWLIVSVVFWFVNLNAKWGWVMDSGTAS